MAKAAIPETFGNWLVDLDDLDQAIPSGVVPTSWQGKTVGEARKELAQTAVTESLEKARALKAAEQLLDWRSWTVDKIQLQQKRGEAAPRPARGAPRGLSGPRGNLRQAHRAGRDPTL